MKRNEIHKIGLTAGLAIVTTSLLSSCGFVSGFALQGEDSGMTTVSGMAILYALICSVLLGLSIFIALCWLAKNKEVSELKKFGLTGIAFIVVDLIIYGLGYHFYNSDNAAPFLLGVLELAAIVLVSRYLLKFTLGRSFAVFGISIGLATFGAFLALELLKF